MKTQSASAQKVEKKEEVNLLKTYFRDVSTIALLTRDEERELAIRSQDGDKEATKRLVESNLRFVIKIAARYRNRGIPFIDLINEGNVGLLYAARKFDPSKGVKFITYAIWWIQQSIKQALAKQSLSVPIPLRQIDELSRIKQKKAELTLAMNREPTIYDVAEGLQVPIEDVERLMRASAGPLSLDDPVYDDRSTSFIDVMVSENLPPPDAQMNDGVLREEIGKLLISLNTREEKVIRMRFGLDGQEPLTLQEIGKLMKLSKERIRQIEKKAMGELQRRAKVRQLEDYLN